MRAAELALADAGLLGDPLLRSGRVGVACGSSIGSTADISDFAQMLLSGDAPGLNANSYVRMMPHTTGANVGIFFGLRGRIIPTSTACTSGSQGVGFAYEAIKHGLQDAMLGGGAEELCPSEAMAFDMLYATSRLNDSPQRTPRPYDRDRDGLVIGEGGAMLLLEEYEHARVRGARIYAEVVGFATNSDGAHVTRPEEETMRVVMELALQSAGLPPSAVGYVNGHGTATEHGDIAETRATSALFGTRMPLSSQKSYLNTPGIADAQVGRDEGRPELAVRVDRPKAALLGMSVTAVADTLRTNIAGTQAAFYRERGFEYPIVVRLREQDRERIGDVDSLLLSTPSGQVIQAKYLVRLESDRGPVSIVRKNQERLTRVNAEVETALSEAVNSVRARLPQLGVPKDFSVGFGAEVEQQARAFGQLQLVLILALVLTYAVMAAQYESLRDPFVIMFSIRQAKKFCDSVVALHPGIIEKITIMQTLMFIRKQYILNPDKAKLKEFS